jgi:predicted TIM-barrel fold metal-dependent hydrolase
MIIDTHCHLSSINYNIKNWEDLYINKYSRYLLFYLAKYYGFKVGCEYSSDLEIFRNNVVEKTIKNIEDSTLDYAILFAIDGVYDENGYIKNKESIIYAPNSFILEQSKKSKKILPGASLNLNRRDVREELEYILRNDFVLIKLHPSMQQVNIADEKYIELYKQIARAEIPLLIHVGFESALPGYNGIKKYNNIENVELPLKCGCTVIAAHGGGTPMEFFGSEEETFNKVKKLLDEYPNLYLDNSATYNFHRPNRAKTMLKYPQYEGRYQYGSDYPNVGAGMIGNIIRVSKRNIFDLDIEEKKSLGFKENTFANICKFNSRINKHIQPQDGC